MDICDYKPERNLEVEFVIGGPPCQSFSAAGRRAAGVVGTNEKRGKLFEEYVRLLKALSPKGFLFENVYGLTGAQGGKSWQKITEAFDEVGYNIEYRILDSSDYGVPQHRERVFIVGTKKDTFLFPRPTHGPDSPAKEAHVSASEALEGLPLDEQNLRNGINGRYGHLLNDIPPGLNYSFYTEKMGHPCPFFAWRSKFSDFLYKADPNMPVRTLKAQGGQYTGPFHWNNRPFTIPEYKRLQTFPDEYRIVGGRQIALHQIGNSVPSQLARILGLAILKQVFHIDLPFELPLLRKNEKLGFRKRKRLLTKLYREKAERSISKMKQDLPENYSGFKKYKADILENFHLIVSQEEKSAFNVEFEAEKSLWSFFVSDKNEEKNTEFTIKIYPIKHNHWALPVQKVFLYGSKLSAGIFKVLWKSFERELIECKIKADLVQLCGYYQYPPIFTCSMSFDKSNAITEDWLVVQSVVSGIGTRKIISANDLSMLLEIPQTHILKQACNLRKLGYEVRNNNTNPQIPINNYLIPYAFPTLNPLSVQLRKSLEDNNVTS